MRNLYICGLMRSGTTIVANFLNTQKNITIYRDYLIPLRNKYRNKQISESINGKEKKELINALVQESEKIGVHLNLDHSKVNTISDIYKASLDAITCPNDNIVGNKCTQSLFVLEELLKDPNILGMYVVRDIRDVILSTKERNLKISKNDKDLLTKQCYQWKTEVKQALDLKRKYPDSFLLIKYEDFVQKKSINQIEDFLGEKLDWTIKTFKDRQGHEFFHNSSFENIKKSDGLSTSSIGRWKKSKQDNNCITEAESICQNELLLLGYL